MTGIIVIALLFLFVYLAVLRPQRRRRLQQAQRLQSIEPGTEVLTAGGIYGTVTGLDDDDLIVEIAEGVEIRLDRRAVGRVIEPDEPDALAEDDAEEPAVGELEAPGDEPAQPGAVRSDPSYSEDPR